MLVRQFLTRYLSGQGVELGALDKALDISRNETILSLRYVDRYRKCELLERFPEFQATSSSLVEPDIIFDVLHGLQPFRTESLDFIVACHLIEHLPDPLFFLEEIWRVLRVGGVCFLALPDKDFLACDRMRKLTPLEHLIDDYRHKMREIEDDHLTEFLELAENVSIPSDPAERESLFAKHRTRSIHVHVWTYKSFCELLLYFMKMHRPFEILDMSRPSDNELREMLFVFEKVTSLSSRTSALLNIAAIFS